MTERKQQRIEAVAVAMLHMWPEPGETLGVKLSAEDLQEAITMAKSIIEQEKQTMIKDSMWIGPEWARWKKVSIVFSALGFFPPKSDTISGEGAFVSNIIQQYQADLSPYEVRGIIDFATRSNPDRITDIQKRGETLELDDVLAGYSED